MRTINKIKLFVNDNDKSKIVAKDLEIELKKYNFEVVTKGKYDLAISIGGDGSFLRMVNETKFNKNIYYIGVNAGTLGFLQEIDVNKCANFVKRLNINDFKVDKLSIQKTKIVTEKEIINYSSLNEFTLRDTDYNLIKVDVKVDGELLEHYVGDGLLFGTPTGSTAYNMSFGGSVIYNTLDTLSIVPIAPIKSRVFNSLCVPIIIPSKKTVCITPNTNKNFIMKIDGVNHTLNDVIKIETRVDDSINCIRMNDYHFIRIVNKKLLGK